MKAAASGLAVAGTVAATVAAALLASSGPGTRAMVPGAAVPEAGSAAAPGNPAPPPGDPAAMASPSSLQGTPPYDGGFHFLRIQYGSRGSGLRNSRFDRRSRGREAPWEHDRPRAEQNFLKILSAATYVNKGEGRDDWLYLPLDDPELFRYPIAYIVEVGQWRPGEDEVRALREYLLKGGFLIVDDFRGDHFYNFEAQMERVLPEHRMFQLSGDHPILPSIRLYPQIHEIFDSFFRIDDPMVVLPPYGAQVPIFLGFFEDNDPEKRLMMIVNFNNDIAEYWEYSDRGYYPIDLANDAYKLGVNYVVYGLTH